MRIIGLLTMCVWLTACTTQPLFPPEVMKDVETETVAFKIWNNPMPDPSGEPFISHKVLLGGHITQVIRKPDGVVFLAEEQPVNKYLGYGPTKIRREGTLQFAVVLKGFPDVDMLQSGNQLAVVGTMESPSSEVVGGTPKVLPHLLAQCLDIWKTDGVETDFAPYESAGYYPLEKRTQVS